jgi:hypothetical protein
MHHLKSHLGGHHGVCHTDFYILKYLKNKYNLQSMIDIGCGPGKMVEEAINMGIESIGIDGDYTLDLKIPFILHDFTHKVLEIGNYDLGWSVEFLEHVDATYINNYMPVFQKCKYIICTAAPPGWPGHHHVNCQPIEYWIKIFESHGFKFDKDETDYIQKNSKMKREFIRNTGMFFKSERL